MTFFPSCIVWIWPRLVWDRALSVIPRSGWMDSSNILYCQGGIPAKVKYLPHPSFANDHLHQKSTPSTKESSKLQWYVHARWCQEIKRTSNCRILSYTNGSTASEAYKWDIDKMLSRAGSRTTAHLNGASGKIVGSTVKGGGAFWTMEKSGINQKPT